MKYLLWRFFSFRNWALTERNISKLKNHLEEMSKDLKEHDKKIWKQIIISVYNAMENDRGIIIENQYSPNESLTKTKP